MDRARAPGPPFPPSAYLRWYRRHLPQARHHLGMSFLHQITPREWGVSVQDLHLHADSDELSRTIAEQYGVRTHQVVPAVGTSAANLQMFDLLLRPGDQVLVEQPVYEPILLALQERRVNLVRFPRRFEDGFAVDLAALRKGLSSRTRLIVVTSLHNPSGVGIPRDTLKEIGRLAKRVGAYVLCDEVYADYLPHGTWSAAASLGPPFISTNSFSKFSGLYGLRVGWALCPPRLAEAAHLAAELSTPPWSEPSVCLAMKAFRDMAWLRQRAAKISATNWKVLAAWLGAHPEYEWVKPTAGVVCYIRRTPRINDVKFAEALLKRSGTMVTPGSFFELASGFRIGFGTPPVQFARALAQFSRGVRNVS